MKTIWIRDSEEVENEKSIYCSFLGKPPTDPSEKVNHKNGSQMKPKQEYFIPEYEWWHSFSLLPLFLKNQDN